MLSRRAWYARLKSDGAPTALSRLVVRAIVGWHQAVCAGTDEVPKPIRDEVLQALARVGSRQWPGNYEVRQLAPNSWCVQSRGLLVPPAGRFVVVVCLVRGYPTHYRIVHGSSSSGTTVTETATADPHELCDALLQACRFGPAVPFLVAPH